MRAFFYLGLFSLQLAQCRLSPDISDLNLNKQGEYRCGIYISNIFENKREEEVYPDLGLLLQNQAVVGFSQRKYERLEDMAEQCHYKCALEKEILYLKQEELKRRIIKNEIRGDLTMVAAELNEISRLKEKWLQGHRSRYRRGIGLLTPEELSHWVFVEQNVRPFEY